uniref:Uncharacterized protein n=1 Tax=Anguilla anguilla TaxID=7936 RepID=A0A0E9RIQ3_ANGAN
MQRVRQALASSKLNSAGIYRRSKKIKGIIMNDVSNTYSHGITVVLLRT